MLHTNPKKYKLQKLFVERKTRISMPKFGMFLRSILQHGNENPRLPVWTCVLQTHPNYSVGIDQDEGEILYDQWSTQEWCNCEKCEKMLNSCECVCCREIRAVKALHLEFKARLSWNTAVQFFAVQFSCVGNHFLEGFFTEMF